MRPGPSSQPACRPETGCIVVTSHAVPLHTIHTMTIAESSSGLSSARFSGTLAGGLVTFGKQGFGFWHHLGLGLSDVPTICSRCFDSSSCSALSFEQNFSYVTSPFLGFRPPPPGQCGSAVADRRAIRGKLYWCGRIDSAAKSGSWGFRLAILPRCSCSLAVNGGLFSRIRFKQGRSFCRFREVFPNCSTLGKPNLVGSRIKVVRVCNADQVGFLACKFLDCLGQPTQESIFIRALRKRISNFSGAIDLASLALFKTSTPWVVIPFSSSA